MQDYHDFIDEILVTSDQIATRVKALGEQLSDDYRGKDLLVVCLLRGGLMFTADLLRIMTIDPEVDCMSLASYGVGRYASSGNVRVHLDLRSNIEGRHILLVEDIIDSGRTLAHVLNMLNTRSPASLRACVLLDKKMRREVEVRVDYTGFDIPDKYVFGYGIDIDEHCRYLPFIASVNLERYIKPA